MKQCVSSVLDYKCDQATISDVLGQLLVNKVCSSDEVLPIIKNVIPIYPSLNRESKSQLLRLCSYNYNFITQMSEYAKELGEKAESAIYQDVVIDVLKLEKGSLFNYVSVVSRSEAPFLKSGLFGSKIFNALSSRISIVDYLGYMQTQWEYLFLHTHQYERLHLELFLTCLQLNVPLGIDIFIESVILHSHALWNTFLEMFSKGSSIHQRRLFIHHLVPYFNKIIDARSCSVAFTLLSQIPFTLPVYSQCFNWSNVYFKIAYLEALSDTQRVQLFKEILPYFEQIDSYSDDMVAEMLVLLLNNLSEDSRDELYRDPLSLSFVTKRLHSEERLVRERTMFIAKLLTNNKLEYDSDFTIDVPNINLEKQANVTLPISIDNIPAEKVNSTAQRDLIKQVKTISLQDSDDEDYEDGEDDDQCFRDILFLKDLVIEFDKAEKDDTSELKLLKNTVKLVRQKKDFPTEVSFYSTQLLKSITTLANKFDEPAFEEWKTNALVSIIVVCPDKITVLYEILFSTELSLQQRMVILTAASLAARELRGFNDDFVLKPVYDFPTKRLPWDAGSRSDKLNEQGKIQDVSDIKNLGTVWRSKRLDIEKSRLNSSQNINKFRKYATKFFYPLAHAWLNGIDLGSFDKIFKMHYLSVLRMIITCANPHFEFETMQTLMEEVLEDAIKQQIPIS